MQEIYACALKSTIRKLKIFSLSSCVLSVFLAPSFIIFSEKKYKYELTAFTVAVSVGSTLLFHKMTSRMVAGIHSKVDLNSLVAESEVLVERYNILGRAKQVAVKIGDLQLSQKPFTTLMSTDGKPFALLPSPALDRIKEII